MAEKYRLYGYRWVVLAVFMFINLTIQMLWITYAPITGPAATYYGVNDLKIGMLSMIFMIAYIPLSIPVSWVIDTYGFRRAVGIGALLMGLFGLLRGVRLGSRLPNPSCSTPGQPSRRNGSRSMGVLRPLDWSRWQTWLALRWEWR
jgi:MFS family permease